MRIGRKETIAGIPAIQLRDYFAGCSMGVVTAPDIAERMGVCLKQSKELIKELMQREFIEAAPEGGGKYLLTLKGNSFRIARCVPPINRPKADKIFSDFMDRVEEINKDDFYLYRIVKVILFGSYINPDAIDFVDIDIAVELESKVKDPYELIRQNEELVAEAFRNGKTFSSFMEELAYSENLVYRKLKNRNRYISIHKTTDDILETAPCKQVYP